MDKAKKLLQELEQEIPQKEASFEYGMEVTYDKDKMSKTISSFVRFLMGDPRIALKDLQTFGNPRVKGLEPGEEYNKMFSDLYAKFTQAVEEVLG